MLFMIKKLFYLILSSVMFICPCYAIQEINEGDVLDINQCVEIALRNSPLVKKAKAQVKIAQAGIGQSKAAWTPYIGAGTGFSGTNSKRGGHSSSNRYFDTDARISQLIYDFGKTNASISAQKFGLIAAEYELEQVELEAAFAVKEAYYSVLAAKANKEIQVQNVEINERYYDQIKSYFDEGIRSRIDFVNAEVNLSDAKYTLLKAQDVYCDAIVKLNKSLYITGNPNYSIAPLEKFNINSDTVPVMLVHSHDTEHNHNLLKEDEVKEISLTGIIRENEIVKDHKISPFDKSFDEVLTIANENRPDLKSYLALKNVAEQNLKYAKRQWLPELSANAGYGYTRSEGFNTNSFSYGADLSIPTLSPVNLKYQIDEAKARAESADEDINLIYQTIYYDVELALCETKIFENQIPLILNKVRQAKENFELADGRYTEGIGNYIELQDARSEYLNAQAEYINTVYQYGLARANLDFAMGVK